MGKYGWMYAQGLSGDRLPAFDVAASHRKAEAAQAELDRLRAKLMKKDSWWRKSTTVTLVNYVWAGLIITFLVCLMFTLVKVF